MDLVSEEELDDLYEENTYRVEEQDLRILKAIISDEAAAREFAASYDYTLFIGDAKPFAKKVIDYYKGYLKPPTRRVMLEIAGVDETLKEEINYIWDEIDRVEFNNSEFHWDLDKLKDRFTKQKLHTIRDSIENLDKSNINYDEELLKIRADLGAAEKIRKGKESAYTQKTLKEYMPEFREEFIRKSKDPELGKGLLTGYSYLDYVTNGMAGSDMAIIAGETGAGKALPLDTKIPTPNGFRFMRDIKPGDYVLGRDGQPCLVVAESGIFDDLGWEFTFNDGSKIVSHNNHEWLTFDHGEQIALSRGKITFKNGGSIKTSEQIAKSIKVGKRNNHAIPLNEAIDIPTKELLINPYVLGLWLGDGHSLDARITTGDDEFKDAFIKAGYVHSKTYNNGSIANTYAFKGLRGQLTKLGLVGNKHIPHNYLWSSKAQRLALLQGLMDSDGTSSKDGNLEFYNTNLSLIQSFMTLVYSLGANCRLRSRVGKINGKAHKTIYAVSFTPHFPAFRLKRKLSRQSLNTRLNRFRYIVGVKQIKRVKTKCIEVSSKDHLFLAGEIMCPTHNSMLLNNMAIQMWIQGIDLENPLTMKGCNVQYFSLEMPYDQCVRRTMSRLSGVSSYGLRDCQLTDEKQLKALSKAGTFIKKFPYEFEVVDIPRGVTIKTIEERYLEAVSKGRRPDVVVIDYLGLMEVEGSLNVDDWLKLGHIAGQLHEFARAYSVIILTAVQLNRPKGKDPSDIIGLHRIGRSSLIMHHATVGIQIETRQDEETYPDMIYHIIKNRNGERGNHLLKKDFRCATVIDMKAYEPLYDAGEREFSNVMPAMEDISSYLDGLGWNK